MSSTSTVPTVVLNTGASMPMIGTGATPSDELQTKDWILTAIEAGYRHIDTAQIYGTENDIASAISQSGVPREEFFITTKLNWTMHNRVPEAIDESLLALGTSYVDLYLLHFPQCAVPNEGNLPQNADGSYKLTTEYNFISSWKHLEAAYRAGKCRAIGVSNFSVKTLEELLASPETEIVPAVNQVELHPYLAQNDLLEYCKSKGIVVVAYAPGGRGVVRQDPALAPISSQYPGVTPTQVILAWHIARGTVVIPKSVNPQRQRENLQIPTLSSEDMEKINQLDRNERISNKRDEVHKQVYGWTYEQLGW